MKTNHISEPQKLHFIGKEEFQELYMRQEERVKLIQRLESLMARLSQYELTPKLRSPHIEEFIWDKYSFNAIGYRITLSPPLMVSLNHPYWIEIKIVKDLGESNGPKVTKGGEEIKYLTINKKHGTCNSLEELFQFIIKDWGNYER